MSYNFNQLVCAGCGKEITELSAKWISASPYHSGCNNVTRTANTYSDNSLSYLSQKEIKKEPIMNYLDEDGYPNDACLDKIKNWPVGNGYDSYHNLMKFIRDKWAFREGYWTEEEGFSKFSYNPYVMYNISTAGWSGNESMIEVLEQNRLFWAACWYQSTTGGHYKFKIPKF